MTEEFVREMLKIHIRAAEAVGKREAAFALLEALQEVEDEIRSSQSFVLTNT